jgi:hypothetical protein
VPQTIPNRGFWMELGGAVADGFAFVVSCGKSSPTGPASSSGAGFPSAKATGSYGAAYASADI